MNQISKFLLIFFVAVIFYQINFAQSDDAWAIEQRCLPEPSTTLPDDWSFDGTLILTSSNKLHAYRQEWETPHILLFSTGWNIPHSGQLSSDGKWFAVIKGDSDFSGVVTDWTLDEIRVIDTSDGTHFTVDWDTGFGATHTLYGRFLEWLPDNKLLYSKTESDESDHETWYVIDPFTREVTDWESNIDPHQSRFYLAPDGQKAVYDNYSGFFLHNGQAEIQLPVTIASWNPDSTQFATSIIDEDRQLIRYSLFDVNGTEITTLAPIPEGINRTSVFPRDTNNAWSSDGRYLLFTLDRLYIADTESEILIDPCIESDYVSMAWSQDSSQLAIIDRRNDDGKIQIIDFSRWERYIVGYHFGEVIGWRADDE